ncbi:group I truncated hemoglobin [Actinopolymorpha alba]|uniref:group I truncated hemoglobin n=1 Tax=Actinopolymorpha alba TaxID=533267 RepID=UPI000373D5E9|nr:group 1 truncated hemoglobin [Actinopolymorpha alba]
MAKHVSESTTPSDYDRIGGASAVGAVVERFYELVRSDPKLDPFFTTVDMPRLKRHQVLLISQVLGGPAEYAGKDLSTAHADLKITRADFQLVASYLVTALEEANVDPDIIGRVGGALATTEKDVVNVGVI